MEVSITGSGSSNVRQILENNSEFRQVLIDELFENEIDYYCSEILEKLRRFFMIGSFKDTPVSDGYKTAS